MESAFFAGYHAFAGTSTEAHIWRLVQCESTWRTVTGGSYLGLAQFDPGTWRKVTDITGLPDWTDPYHQGAAVAVWAELVQPGSRAGWPVCWSR